MKKIYLLFCLSFLFQMTYAQQSSGLSLGMSGEYGFMSLRETFQWNGRVEDFQPGNFVQIGVNLDYRWSDHWGLQTGLQLSRYQYTEEASIFFPLDVFNDLILFPTIEEVGEQTRVFTALSIPILLQYHLEDLVPGKLHLAITGGFVTNFKTGNNIDDDFFHSSMNKLSVDGQIGPNLYWHTKSGMLMVGPVFRMAVTNYAINGQLDGSNQTRNLQPYSLGIQAGYFWHL